MFQSVLILLLSVQTIGPSAAPVPTADEIRDALVDLATSSAGTETAIKDLTSLMRDFLKRSSS